MSDPSKKRKNSFDSDISKKQKLMEDILRFIIINSLSDEENESDSYEENDDPIFGPQLYIDKVECIIKFHKQFSTLQQLIELAEKYDPSKEYICNLDMKKLHNMVGPLKELNNLVGLKKFKRTIVDQLIFILTAVDNDSKPMLHTCMYGQPGVGKTAVCKILAKIYATSGLLSKGHFKVVKRDDFISKFLGDTALKTQKLLEEAKGGVLFIDEVYSFGSSKNEDYFAKEAIDTLNLYLSEHYEDFVCIVAGYKEPIKKCFFGQNPGLERRFTYKYTLDGYSPQEMTLIFKSFVKKEGWKVSEETLDKMTIFFREHLDAFPYFGGDIKTLFDKCKINHMRNIVMLDKKFWKFLIYEDIVGGFEIYLEQREINDIKDDGPPPGMFM